MTEPADSRDLTTSVESYLAPLRHHRRTIAVVTVATIALGTLAAVLGPKSYTADTSILIYPVSANPTEALRATDRSSDMTTEIAIADSRGVAQRVVDGFSELGIAVNRSTVTESLTVSAVKDSRVLDIAYRSTDPATSRIGAELAAAAYLDYRGELNEASRQTARLSATRALADLQTRLMAAEQALDRTTEGTPAHEAAKIESDAIEGEIGAQQSALAGLSILTLDAAAVIDAPQQPQFADGPGPQPLVAGSAVGGLVLGVIVAWVLTGFGFGPEVRRYTPRPSPAGRRRARPAAGPTGGQPFDDTENRDPLELIRALDGMEHAEAALSQREKVARSAAEEPAIDTPEESGGVQSFSDMYPIEFIGESVAAASPQPEAEPEPGDDAAVLSANPEPLNIDDLLDAPPPADDPTDLQPGDTGFDPTASTGDLGPYDGTAADDESNAGDLADWDIITPADEESGHQLVPPPAIIAPTNGDGTDDPLASGSTHRDAHFGGADDAYEPIDDTTVDPFGSTIDPSPALDPGHPGHDVPEHPDTLYPDLGHTDPGYANPEHANPEHADLGYANPEHANPEHADLGYANPEHANPEHANPEHADLGYADLGYADLEHADLEHADPEYADPGPGSSNPAFVGSAWEQVTDGQAPTGEAATGHTDGLVATRDLDGLFDVLSELGAAGPVVILGLSDVYPTTGLTVGFELADELRALGARVLLIDGRIDEPAMNNLFDDGAAVGLAQALTGETVLSQAVRSLPGLDGLDLLPVGTTDSGSARQMTGTAFERLLAEARMLYHSVVIIGDTVPTHPTAGSSLTAGFDPERTRALAQLVDGVIVGTDQAVGTPARSELSELLDSLPAPVLQLTAASDETALDPGPEAPDTMAQTPPDTAPVATPSP